MRSRGDQDLRARLLRGETSRADAATASSSLRDRFPDERSWREGDAPDVVGVRGDGGAERVDARVWGRARGEERLDEDPDAAARASLRFLRFFRIVSCRRTRATLRRSERLAKARARDWGCVAEVERSWRRVRPATEEGDAAGRVPCVPLAPRAALRDADDREVVIEEGPGSAVDVDVE